MNRVNLFIVHLGVMHALNIPVFPLDIALLPGEEVELHIFEPRYKKLFTEMIDNSTNAGILFEPLNHEIRRIGITFSIVAVLRTYSSGEFDVKVKGEQLFELIELHTKVAEGNYPRAWVRPSKNDFPEAVPKELVPTVNRILEFDEGVKKADSTSMNNLVRALSLPLNEKQMLDREIIKGSWRGALDGYLKFQLAIKKQMEKLQGNYHLN
ncbi:LON peptidase substrate-binding domain-containing protein [Luteibaculum oceani]|uniref:LON peptidase substrate-binding domain-containing protein n=1 Tax=Luteibaculum oceani TaxID=1294296 RepID=UPI001477868C|nr:LON peptidase substrate-binding domain-containing protein [Luteibaculum oceani]